MVRLYGLRLALCGGSLLSSLAMAAAVSPKVAQIFDKNARTLSPPPKSLTADPAVRAGKKELPEGDDDERSFSRASGRKAREPQRRAANSESLDVSIPSALTNDEENERAQPVIDSPRASRSSATRSTRKSRSNSERERVLGLGFVGAGAYGVFGAELEITLTPAWSAGFGIGTGLSYSTWGAYTRYYFGGNGRLQPFGQFGYANWHVGKANSRKSDIRPSYLSERFFENDNGVVAEDTTAHILYPGLGVLYQHNQGLAFSAQLQYFISAPSFQGAPGGALSFYYYF